MSAALVLGRCRRRVLLCDAGAPRNARAREMHGYLTRDCVPPREFLQLAHEQLAPYDTVERRRAEVVEARCLPKAEGFEIVCRDGSRFTGSTLLLATGVVDEIPAIDGLQALYGTSVHHCPYCDAWEWRDQPLAAYGKHSAAVGLAVALRQWSADVVLVTDGRARLSDKHRAQLQHHRIPIREERIACLEGRDGLLQRVVFKAGEPLLRSALFFASTQHQRSPLPEQLGCRFTKKGAVATGLRESTPIPGLFVAGDASKDVQFVIVAAAEGAQAAVSINMALQQRDLQAE